METCVPYRTLAMENQLYLNRLAAREGRLRVEQVKADTCIAQMESRACNPKPGMTNPMIDPMAMDACIAVFVGNTAVGNECIYANECVAGARCVQDAGAVGRGVCVPYQEETQICNVDADCDPKVRNLYCAKEDFHCHLRAKLNERCAYTTDAAGKNPTTPLLLECDNSLGNVYCDPVSSTCRQLPSDGEACVKSVAGLAIPQCDPDTTLSLVCDTTTSVTGVCRAPGKLGDDCTTHACGKDLYCPTSTGVLKRCTALPTLGGDCSSTTSNYRCKTPYFCNTQAGPPYECAEPASVGESCATITCGTDLFCDVNTRVCKYRLPDGSVCVNSTDCLSLDCRALVGTTIETCQPRTIAVQCTGR
jgi:hypothetical protein